MADEEKSEKAALWRRIVMAVDEETLADRMRLHGFWPWDAPLPADPDAAERATVEAEIGKLQKESKLAEDPQKALARERVRRWQESKKRRAEAKVLRAQERAARRAAWETERSGKLVHAGAGVSGGLEDSASDAARLGALGLPVLSTAAELAAAMGTGLGTLRWLTFHRRGATLVHYHRYDVPKKTGGRRGISAPKTVLARAQQWVLARILDPIEPEADAHGFRRGRSIRSNASPHAGRAVVVNMDLEEFFPTVAFRRVKGLFRKLGYSEQVATVLALLTTEPPRAPVTLDGKLYRVALGDRVLPQGACTSPAITNLVCRRLDRRLRGLAAKAGFQYTRYADDLTFSGDRPAVVGRLLKAVRAIVTDEGFRENAKKTRVMRRARRQDVTGVVVNVRPNLSRAERRRLRAILHNSARHGLASQNRAGHPRFADHLRGRVAYASMLDPDRAPMWRAALTRALVASGR